MKESNIADTAYILLSITFHIAGISKRSRKNQPVKDRTNAELSC